MPLEYDTNTKTTQQSLEAVLDDYTGWFLQVTQRIFYSDQHGTDKGQPLERPLSFGVWIKEIEEGDTLSPRILKDVKQLHAELIARADQLIMESAKNKIPPTFDDYGKLTVLFEEFAGRLRRIERDALIEDSGIDALTGLRTKDMMEKDIKREMDRLARQGKSFAVALVRIDNFEKNHKDMTPQEADDCVRVVAEMVKKSMRSFDDAYRMDDGMFVLSLKQTGTGGGIRALKRLKAELDKTKATCSIQGEPMPISLSSCIGEPAEGENMATFMDNLKNDLDSYGSGGSVLEHFEMSPLQRYIRDKDRGQA